MIDNLTNMICVHDQNSIDKYMKDGSQYSPHFFDSTLFAYNSPNTDISKLNTYQFNAINLNTEDNPYRHLNKRIGKFSGLLYLFSRPDLVKNDYLFYRSCGWHYKPSTTCEFKLMDDSVLTAGYLTQNYTAYESYERSNFFLCKILPWYFKVVKDPLFEKWIMYNTYKVDVNNIYPKNLFGLFHNETEVRILPFLNEFIRKFPEESQDFDNTIHLFVLHFSYMLVTNCQVYSTLEFTYNSPDRSLHKNTP